MDSTPPGLEKVAGHPSYLNRKRNIESFIKEMKYIQKFYYEDALIYLKNKDYNNAVVLFTKYLGLFYNSSDAYFNRALAYFFQTIHHANENDLFWDYEYKFDTEFTINLSEKKDKVSLLKSRNDLEKAITLADKNIDEMYILLGVLNAELGDYDDSLKYLNKSLKTENYNCAAITNIGLIYYKKGDSEKAINQLRNSASDCPGNSVLHFDLAQMVFLKVEKQNRTFQAMQTLLNPYDVYVPYDEYLAMNFPINLVRVRRDFTRFLILIKTICLLYQYQREKNKNKR